MTNLQILLSELDLSEKDEQKAIIENFKNQDEKKFIIDDEVYKILSFAEVEDEFFEEVENAFLKLEAQISYTKYRHLIPYIDFDSAVDKRIKDIIKNNESIEGYTFIGEHNQNYIYLVE